MSINKELLREEYSKIWDTEKMVNFCVNKAAAVAELSSGELIPVDKQHIKTSFCFGESGYDYDEAQDMASIALNSSEYFKRENMAEFGRWVDALREQLDGEARQMLVVYHRTYTGQPAGCRIASIGFERLTDILCACGGSAFVSELPGKALTVCGRPCRILERADVERVLTAYEEAAAGHEKKVAAYLKKYGTSKVHAWTYWRDA